MDLSTLATLIVDAREATTLALAAVRATPEYAARVRLANRVERLRDRARALSDRAEALAEQEQKARDAYVAAREAVQALDNVLLEAERALHATPAQRAYARADEHRWRLVDERAAMERRANMAAAIDAANTAAAD